MKTFLQQLIGNKHKQEDDARMGFYTGGLYSREMNQQNFTSSILMIFSLIGSPYEIIHDCKIDFSSIKS